MTTFTEIVATVVVHSSAVALSHFGVTMEPLGGIRNDDRVVASIVAKKPLVASQPSCQFSIAIEGMAMRLVHPGTEVRHD